MKQRITHLREEADIGSGEKTPGQQDTEKFIEQIGTREPPPTHPLDGKQQRDPLPPKGK